MDGFDATELAERLNGEQQDYWVHVEAESPLEKYPAKQHARRVADNLGVSDGLIFLPGQVARTNEDSDMPAPFRQRRYFYYLTGCNEPNCYVAYSIESDCLTLFIPRINPARVIWYGRGSTPAEALLKYDIDSVLYVDQLYGFISKWLDHNKSSLYALDHTQLPFAEGTMPKVDRSSLRPAMNSARMIKDPHEIKLIRKANDISSRAHKEVLANILRFKNEAQVQGLFLDVCVSHQAKQQAYDIIAASGPNAGTLHYDANNEDFDDRQLMCLDAGCEWQLYASDITRTFPLSGKWPTEESKQIYRLVERMQETCISRLAPGVRFLDLHILAHQIAIDGLMNLGILHNGTKEEIFKAGTSVAFFPHGLGHHVGLEVHDVGQRELMSGMRANTRFQKALSLYPENYHLPVYDAERCRAPVDPQSPHLEEGMVVTVEPGIYFSTYALNMFFLPSPIHSKYINVSVLQKYLPVGGVRIEDDILITSKGFENLTTAPKGDDMLAIIRGGSMKVAPVLRSKYSGPAPPPLIVRRQPSLQQDERLFRAPGISKDPELIMRPMESTQSGIKRAATLPVRNKEIPSVDLEPFTGPSLFSNFKRSSTIDLGSKPTVHGVAATPQNAAPVSLQLPQGTTVCGDNFPQLEHSYINTPTQPRHRRKPICPKCHVLVSALDRLRQSVSSPGQGVPKPVDVPAPQSKARLGADQNPNPPELHCIDRTMRGIERKMSGLHLHEQRSNAQRTVPQPGPQRLHAKENPNAPQEFIRGPSQGELWNRHQADTSDDAGILHSFSKAAAEWSERCPEMPDPRNMSAKEMSQFIQRLPRSQSGTLHTRRRLSTSRTTQLRQPELRSQQDSDGLFRHSFGH